MQPVPSAWVEAETRASALIRQSTGNDLVGHLLERLCAHPGTRMLSLGSGPGGIEIELARKAPEAKVVCVDINPDLLRLGRQRAEALALKVQFAEGDLNTVALPPGAFDLVFCHAALHHVIELEALADQIKRTLRPGGVLITVDVVTRNGYLMWPETREVVQAIWKTLPVKFRLNHTGHPAPLIDDEIWEADMFHVLYIEGSVNVTCRRPLAPSAGELSRAFTSGCPAPAGARLARQTRCVGVQLDLAA